MLPRLPKLPLLGTDSRPKENDGTTCDGAAKAGEPEGGNEGDPRCASDGDPERDQKEDAVRGGIGDSLRLLGGRGSSLELGDSDTFPSEPPGDFSLRGGVDACIREFGVLWTTTPSSASSSTTRGSCWKAPTLSDSDPEWPSEDMNDSSTI